MMPERKARVDFQKPQIALHVALEIELGDASEAEPLDDVAASSADIGRVRDLESGGVAEAHGIGADLAAAELAGHAPLRVDVAMIALDPGFGPVHEFLRQPLASSRRSRRREYSGAGLCRSDRIGAARADAPESRLALVPPLEGLSGRP